MYVINIGDLVLREDGSSNCSGLLSTEERVLRGLHHVVSGSQMPSYWEGKDCFERPLKILLEARTHGFEVYHAAMCKIVSEFAPTLDCTLMIRE